MIKVFEDFDYMKVGQMQSVLESHDIPTFLKNQFGFGGTGELPFIETVPQLFVVITSCWMSPAASFMRTSFITARTVFRVAHRVVGETINTLAR